MPHLCPTGIHSHLPAPPSSIIKVQGYENQLQNAPRAALCRTLGCVSRARNPLASTPGRSPRGVGSSREQFTPARCHRVITRKEEPSARKNLEADKQLRAVCKTEQRKVSVQQTSAETLGQQQKPGRGGGGGAVVSTEVGVTEIMSQVEKVTLQWGPRGSGSSN